MKQFDLRTQQKIAWGLLAVAMIVYAIEMSHQTVLRYDVFKATAFDLGNMDQVLWNTIHGRPFQFSNQAVDWYGPPIRLALHFEPIILPLSLLYIFHADPRILLLFQTFALTSGALPVFILTRKYLPEWPLIACFMVLAYFLSPALLGLNIFDFHPYSLATPFLLYAVLALDYKRYGWFVLACIAAAACKEDVPVAVAMLGILVIWLYKLPRLGIALTIGGLLWSILAFTVIMPHYYPGLLHNNFWYRYEALGSSPGAAVVNIIIHPWLLFTTFFTIDRLYYLASLGRDTLFLGLLAPEWLLPALPALAVNLLSTDPLLYSGVFHYNAAIIPFVMIAAIHGSRRLLLRWYGWRNEDLKEGFTAAPWQSNGQTSIAELAAIKFMLVQFKRSTFSIRFKNFFMRPVMKIGSWGQQQWKRLSERLMPLAQQTSPLRLQWIISISIIIMIALNFLISTPQLNAFWADHEPGSHEQHIQQLLAMIPADASVSASANLNPHLSDRQHLAVFPSIVDETRKTVQYVIVDLNNIFPEDRVASTTKLNQLVNSKQFRVLAFKDSVMLLIRVTPK